jgi:hypothetical protein
MKAGGKGGRKAELDPNPDGSPVPHPRTPGEGTRPTNFPHLL